MGMNDFLGFPGRNTKFRSKVHVSAGNGATSSVKNFSTIDLQTGTAITYLPTGMSPIGGDTFRINEDGLYSMTYTDGSNVGITLVIAKNVVSSATAFSAISPITNILAHGDFAANLYGQLSTTAWLDAGDLVQCRQSTTSVAATNEIYFRIEKLGPY